MKLRLIKRRGKSSFKADLFNRPVVCLAVVYLHLKKITSLCRWMLIITGWVEFKDYFWIGFLGVGLFYATEMNDVVAVVILCVCLRCENIQRRFGQTRSTERQSQIPMMMMMRTWAHC